MEPRWHAAGRASVLGEEIGNNYNKMAIYLIACVWTTNIKAGLPNRATADAEESDTKTDNPDVEGSSDHIGDAE